MQAVADAVGGARDVADLVATGRLDRGRVGDDGLGQVAGRDRVERDLQGGRVLALERAQAIEDLRGRAADAAADEEDDGGGEQGGQQAGEDPGGPRAAAADLAAAMSSVWRLRT